MEKLRDMLEKWLNGEKIRGWNVTVAEIRMIQTVYTEIASGQKPAFIMEKVKDVLNFCGIDTCECGVGWKVI